MAHNVNNQAIVFSNSKIRPMADLLYTAYYTAKSVLSQWTGQSISTVLPNDANLIEDGATVASGQGDGRPPISDAQATNIINRCTDLINWMEGSAAISAGDGSKSILNTIVAVQVNGKSTL